MTLEKIWSGEITKWTELKEGGDTFTGGSACEAPFTRLVRLDESGTTHILKKYLNLINDTPIETAGHGKLTWAEMSEEANNNEAWPEAAHVKAAAKEGGGALVAEVAATPDSIGYASLADARSNGGFSKTGRPGPEILGSPPGQR